MNHYSHRTQEILHLLARLSEQAPDVRIGQLIANLLYLSVRPTNEAVWDMEDERLVTAIRQQIENLSERHVEVALRVKRRSVPKPS